MVPTRNDNAGMEVLRVQGLLESIFQGLGCREVFRV